MYARIWTSNVCVCVFVCVKWQAFVQVADSLLSSRFYAVFIVVCGYKVSVCVYTYYVCCLLSFGFFSSYPPSRYPLASPLSLLMCGFLRQLVDSHTYRVAASRRVTSSTIKVTFNEHHKTLLCSLLLLQCVCPLPKRKKWVFLLAQTFLLRFIFTWFDWASEVQ